MARYIGARYVPVFAGDWDQTREYEALTVVQYQGDSYTSKMYVPVGIAISNTQYWIKSANFNQQVAAMGSRIDALQGQYDQDIEDLQGNVEDIQGDITALGTRVDGCLPTSFVTNDLPTIIKNAFFTEQKGIVFNSVPAKGIRRGTVDAAKSGATFLGVVGCYTVNTDFIAGGAMVSQGTTVTGAIYNAGSQTDNAELLVKCLYVKNTL